ncbi:MAG: TAXI family TRAP transporter solute-binding subunit [Bacteroidota bacterium]
MNKNLLYLVVTLFITACNPNTLEFSFIYNDEGPNEKIAQRMEELLESEFNVDIRLVKGLGTEQNLDSLSRGTIDIGLVENYVKYREGINSAFAVYSEVLHIFYRKEIGNPSFENLFTREKVYIGMEESPTYNLIMDLFDFYGIPSSSVDVTFEMGQASVVVVLTNLLSEEMLDSYQGYNLYSFETAEDLGEGSVVEGISLKYPRLEPFLVPKKAYWNFTKEPVVTLSVDLVMMVRSGMGEIAVNDFTKTMLRNRQVFTTIDPLLYEGMREDFDQSKLNIPLHEGARIFLDRDEPSFIERYAELGGVILSIIIAVWSGLVSLAKWQSQKKKDKIDEFYEDLINIKNSVQKIKQKQEGLQKIKHIQKSQNRAFSMLISEELVANESFRIYMELSKETINDVKNHLRMLKPDVPKELA